MRMPINKLNYLFHPEGGDVVWFPLWLLYSAPTLAAAIMTIGEITRTNKARIMNAFVTFLQP